MLRRISSTKNADGREWFQGTEIELMLWRDPQHQLKAFELAQRQPFGDQLLRWHSQTGFSWHRIDSGETRNGHYKASPILHSTEASALRDWHELLTKEGGELPSSLAAFLLQLVATD